MGRLRLHRAETFWQRLLGLHAYRPLGRNEGLLLKPCRAVHSLFLRQALDLVFLDAAGRPVRVVRDMKSGSLAWARDAHMVVELPAGYCRAHPDYLARIHAALHLRVCPRLSK